MVWGLVFFLSWHSLSKCQHQANRPPTHSSSGPLHSSASPPGPHLSLWSKPLGVRERDWALDTPILQGLSLPHLNNCSATSFPLLASGPPWQGPEPEISLVSALGQAPRHQAL